MCFKYSIKKKKMKMKMNQIMNCKVRYYLEKLFFGVSYEGRTVNKIILNLNAMIRKLLHSENILGGFRLTNSVNYL